MNALDDRPPPIHPIGEVRVRPPTREVWLASADSPLRCGPGQGAHRFRDHLAWTDGCLRCDHQLPSGGACDRLVYFLGGNFHDARGVRRMFVVAHVSPEEARHMREAHMLYEQAIAYLGIGLLP